MLSREPCPALRPFIAQLWASGPAPQVLLRPMRERVLPTGCAHLVFRPDAPPLRVFDLRTRTLAAELTRCVLAGPRSLAYERSTHSRAPSVGAVLRAGAARSIVRSPLTNIAEQHFDARDVLGPSVDELCERLADARSAAQQLDELEAFLLAIVASATPLPTMVRRAVRDLERDPNTPISALVAQSNASHRHFCATFEAHVGLTPKRFARVRRFDRAARALAVEGVGVERLAAIAARLGFSDQAHLSREFAAHSALTPSEYLRATPVEHRHVPIHDRSILFKTRAIEPPMIGAQRSRE